MKDLYDIHCHILPGVDDGAKDMEMAVKMIEQEKKAGVETIILTPHFRKEMFETPMEKIYDAFDALAYEVRDMKVHLYLGCEFYASTDMTKILDKGMRPTLAGSPYVLTEFSTNTPQAFIKERTNALLISGYRPIIAHIERYRAMRKDLAFIEELIEMGCEMQVNADSIIGKDGFAAQRFCKNLIQADMLHYVGSDAHNMKRRASHIGECCEYLKKNMGRVYTGHIFRDNPRKILESAGYTHE